MTSLFAFSSQREDGFTLRALLEDDFERGHIDILSQLTTTANTTKDMYQAQFDRLLQSKTTKILVIEDPDGAIVGTATLLVEDKFTHGCGRVGHIEDVVTASTCRGRGMGKKLILALLEVAREEGCYKVILDAGEKNVPFYEKCGFVQKECQMRFDM